MKKSLLLIPVAALVLSACGSSTPAPVVSAKNSKNSSSTQLAPVAIQPVSNANVNYGGWQTDVQQSVNVPQPVDYNSVPQPVVNNVVSTPAPQQPVATTTNTTTRSTARQSQVSQNFEIPRDENNAPIYSQIEKGFYNGNSYTVRKGDTMFLIAYIAGKDVKEIAALNNMSEPYQLRVGQTLRLGASTATPAIPAPTVTTSEPEVTYSAGANGTTYASDGNITGPIKAGVGSANNTPAVRASVGTATTAVTATAATAPAVRATTATAATTSTPAVRATTVSSATSASYAPASNIKWKWPTNGRITQGFSTSEGGNKGIDIAGSKGQDVFAAADGKVVYAGNALQGYGNLIIIKHNDDFLSAYAHNDKIKVDEQDKVKAGQKIATLGSTGTNSNKLHFEIRYKGKSVDPTRYLPKR